MCLFVQILTLVSENEINKGWKLRALHVTHLMRKFPDSTDVLQRLLSPQPAPANQIESRDRMELGIMVLSAREKADDRLWRIAPIEWEIFEDELADITELEFYDDIVDEEQQRYSLFLRKDSGRSEMLSCHFPTVL